MNSYAQYLSAGINQTKNSLDWNSSQDIIAYASSNNIVLYDPKRFRVIGVSNEGHGTCIRCVQWISLFDSDSRYLLSTSTNGSIKIWVFDDTEASLDYVNHLLKCVVNFQAHNGCISSGFAVFLQEKPDDPREIFVLTTADDFLIKGWRVNVKSGTSEIIFNYKLPGRSLALDLVAIPDPNGKWSWPLVVYAGDDQKVHILTSIDGSQYEQACSLPGHEDWVTSLKYKKEDGDILLASGSKEGLIRLWRFSLSKPDVQDSDLKVKNVEITIPTRCSGPDSVVLNCTLESVLSGHDGFVSCLDWQSKFGGTGFGSIDGCHGLLSCAKTEDRSVILWEPNHDKDGELWVEKARLGEVGGNREGFWNARINPDGTKIVATSYQGGLHMWLLQEESWVPQPVVSGHFKDVVDIDWDKEGLYLLSSSLDQTTRLHVEMKGPCSFWQEISRPQVHGYDMSCVACLNRFKFVSGAEEKVVRGFKSTKDFVRRFLELSKCSLDLNISSLDLPDSASVPSLGLSNKGGDVQKVDQGFNLRTAPTEDELMMGTLWPEQTKLYGHGNEILAIAASHDGKLLASSCRATTALDAKIIIWSTEAWAEVCSLSQHRLSVTQIEFSSCDQYLLSVSRDRTWTVFQRSKENEFVLRAHSSSLDKKFEHSRIIWSCAWVPNSLSFVTGSRDKSVALWSPVRDDGGHATSWQRSLVLQESGEVVAVAASNVGNAGEVLIAIGYVNGSIHLKLIKDSREVISTLQLPICHKLSVRRLKFRPEVDPTNPSRTLASCGNDNALYIQNITRSRSCSGCSIFPD